MKSQRKTIKNDNKKLNDLKDINAMDRSELNKAGGANTGIGNSGSTNTGYFNSGNANVGFANTGNNNIG